MKNPSVHWRRIEIQFVDYARETQRFYGEASGPGSFNDAEPDISWKEGVTIVSPWPATGALLIWPTVAIRAIQVTDGYRELTDEETGKLHPDVVRAHSERTPVG